MSPESFDGGWLALREGADHRSRATELLEPLREWWSARGGRSVIDLGAGTGSNLRYLSAALHGPQEWTLVDHDRKLLSLVESPGADARFTTVRDDLTSGGLARIAGADLVTSSALLDLVSEKWLTSAVEACSLARAAALFVLSYDGTVEWSGEADPMDASVLHAVNRHQRGDKGFGPALGPAAGRAAEAAFCAEQYRTVLAPSPWVLDGSDAELVRALVDGWAAVAVELRAGDESSVRAWAARRCEGVATGRVRLTVGHWDLLALPPGEPPR